MIEKNVEASVWIGHGTGMVTRRDALPVEHPESWVSLWIKKYGSLDDFPYENLGMTKPPLICIHCGKPVLQE